MVTKDTKLYSTKVQNQVPSAVCRYVEGYMDYPSEETDKKSCFMFMLKSLERSKDSK